MKRSTKTSLITLPSQASRWPIILSACALFGCASYGLGQAPQQASEDHDDAITSRWSVSTIAVDAHHDIDASSLTLTLIDRLEAHGLGPLRWGGAALTQSQLKCRVSALSSDAYGQQLVVMASLSCASSPPIAGANIEVHQRSSALLPEALGSGTLQSAEQRLKLQAILGAIDQAAGPLSRALAASE